MREVAGPCSVKRMTAYRLISPHWRDLTSHEDERGHYCQQFDCHSLGTRLVALSGRTVGGSEEGSWCAGETDFGALEIDLIVSKAHTKSCDLE